MGVSEDLQRILVRARELEYKCREEISHFPSMWHSKKSDIDIFRQGLYDILKNAPLVVAREAQVIMHEMQVFNESHAMVVFPKIIPYLESMIQKLNSSEVPAMKTETLKSCSDKVFIVHGHDEAMKQATARLVQQLGFSPIILHELPNQGMTIIEKFERHADTPAFAVALYSPDDSTEDGMKRARQNVVFEHGYFVGKLGRNRVVCLYCENVERPSDLDGVLYVEYDTGGHWKYLLANEMQAAGLDVDKNKIK